MNLIKVVIGDVPRASVQKMSFKPHHQQLDLKANYEL